MAFVPIVAWSHSEEMTRLFQGVISDGGFSKYGEYAVAKCEMEAYANIALAQTQLLITGVLSKDVFFAERMKSKNAGLKALQFGLTCFSGPPKSPFDTLVTLAHPDHNYKNSLIWVMKEFLDSVRNGKVLVKKM